MQQQLFDLYTEFKQRLRVQTPAFLSSFGVPLLADLDDAWCNATHRLLWIGQEPGVSAIHPPNDLPTLSSLADFASHPRAIEIVQADNRHWFNGGNNALVGPFHRYLREALGRLQADALAAAVFSNVVRCASNLGTGYPIQHVPKADRHAFLQLQTDLLRQEMSILKPTICIFVAGPRYDWHIQQQFPGCAFRHLPLAPYGVNPAIDTVRRSAKLSADNLASHSYRTYHPGYLQRVSQPGGLGPAPIHAFINDYLGV